MLQILRLPEVLNLQLLRFYFDMATLSKRKALDSVAIPEFVNMTALMSAVPSFVNADLLLSKPRKPSASSAATSSAAAAAPTGGSLEQPQRRQRAKKGAPSSTPVPDTGKHAGTPPTVIDVSADEDAAASPVSAAGTTSSGAGRATPPPAVVVVEPDSQLEAIVAATTREPAAGDVVYDLVAILQHRGYSASSGHYVANIRDSATGQWWFYDDDTVTAQPLDDKARADASKNAYMIVYQRRRSDPLASAAQQDASAAVSQGHLALGASIHEMERAALQDAELEKHRPRIPASSWMAELIRGSIADIQVPQHLVRIRSLRLSTPAEPAPRSPSTSTNSTRNSRTASPR
jgi:hypothetical protein